MTFTVLAGEIIRTLADIIIDAVYAGAAILTDVILAIVYILCAVDAVKAGHALARIVGEVIVTFGAIRAGIELVAAEVDLCIAVLTCRMERKIYLYKY